MAKHRIAIFYITDKGFGLAQRLGMLYPESQVLKFESGLISPLWDYCRAFIFIMATGIVVRTIAPLIKDKKTDPAVVVLDEKGMFAISLLSGHLGGANKMSQEIADFLEAEAVITTSSDVNSVISIDLWAEENSFIIENHHLLPQIATRLLNNRAIQVYSDVTVEMPHEFLKTTELESADILITNKILNKKDRLYLRPKNLVIGIGCHPGTSAEEIENAVLKVFHNHGLSFSSACCLSTINLRADEPGLIAFGQKYQLKRVVFTPEELNYAIGVSRFCSKHLQVREEPNYVNGVSRSCSKHLQVREEPNYVNGVSCSQIVFKATGAYAVAEPAAILASESSLLVHKQKIRNVTVAVAELNGKISNLESRIANCELKNQKDRFEIRDSRLEIGGMNHSKVYIIGTGPGGLEHLTPYAKVAIRKSEIIVGYGPYLALIQKLIKNKTTFSTGMTHEIDRCQKAIDIAVSGKTVAIISSGDPGIYAMAGLVFELLRKQSLYSNLPIPYVEVIPGISALNACAARLGAPLMHDFACISLSDRLTPWDLIEKRLEASAKADFVIALYNPKSRHRQTQINRAREIILKYRSKDTPVGIVTAAMRESEKIVITNLQNMLDYEIDMQTTIIIGNSQTFLWGKSPSDEGSIHGNWMITPRGYVRS